MSRLQRLLEKPARLVVGLMSGTSLDGVDAVAVHLEGTGQTLKMDQRAFISLPYPEELRRLLLEASAPATSSVFNLSQLNVRLAHVYADAVRQVLETTGLATADLDLVGSHGQTVHHIPVPADCAGQPTTSTLQIGDPSVLANLLGVPVVGDFRLADMGLGGQGAPLVPYFDYVCYAHADEHRGLLNLGGIANITVLPRGGTADTVYAFDTGPANMVMDALARHFFGHAFDPGGQFAEQGRAHPNLLATLLENSFYLQPPPKSTGRELFNEHFVDDLIQRGAALGCSPEDLMATAAQLTVQSIYRAYTRFIQPKHPLDVLIVSGGGLHNTYVIQTLANLFDPIPLHPTDAYGLDADAKEALCFAVLAHETLNGTPTSLPSVTGAKKATVLGKICMVG